MRLPVAILAGGLATRLRPITETIPKSLVEVAGKPFVVHQLELLRRHGLQQVVLCVGHLGEMVHETLGDGRPLGLDIHYSFDGDRLLGTAGALKRAAGLLGDAFFVLYGDSYLDVDYAAVETAFRASGQKGLMTVCRNRNQWDRSNVLFQNGRILRYDKRRPAVEMEHIDFGLGVLGRAALELVPPDEPCDLASLYGQLVASDELAGYVVEQRFYEIGSPKGLEETRQYLLKHKGSTR